MCRFAFVVLAVMALAPRNVRASWLPLGNAVGSGPGNQDGPHVATDGAGGIFVAWTGDPSVGGLYLQRLALDGTELWPAGGIVATPDHSSNFELIADGLDGAIVLWSRGDGGPIALQRIDANGIPLWGATGTQPENNTYDFAFAADGTGGGILITDDANNGDLLARRLTADGSVAWTVRDTAYDGAWGYDVAVPDGQGGAIFATQTHIQRVDPSGHFLWGRRGVRFWSDPVPAGLVPDGQGGVLMVFQSYGSHIVAERLDAFGNNPWGYAQTLSSDPPPQDAPALCADGSGGGFFAWVDYRSGSSNVVAQHVSSNGVQLWPYNGIEVCSGGSWKTEPVAIGDMLGGAIFAWEDRRNGDLIVAQDIDGAGNWMWEESGRIVAAGPNRRTMLNGHWLTCMRVEISDGRYGAYLVWQDARNGNDDVFATDLINDRPTAVAVGAATCTVAADGIRLRWCAPQNRAASLTVYRREDDLSWEVRASVTADPMGGVEFHDRAVTAGTSYDYCLGISRAGVEERVGLTRVDVPATTEWRLAGAHPNPAKGSLSIDFTLPDDVPARLEVFDVTGRCVATQDVGRLGAGRHTTRVLLGRDRGVWMIRLTRAGRTLTARAVTL